MELSWWEGWESFHSLYGSVHPRDMLLSLYMSVKLFEAAVAWAILGRNSGFAGKFARLLVTLQMTLQYPLRPSPISTALDVLAESIPVNPLYCLPTSSSKGLYLRHFPKVFDCWKVFQCLFSWFPNSPIPYPVWNLHCLSSVWSCIHWSPFESMRVLSRF